MTLASLDISVVILTFNEEKNIQRTLASVNEWAGEIFIVDSGSTDQTLAIARQYTDKILVHEFTNYAQQRNWAQNNLSFSYEWIFHLDADEQVSLELTKSLHHLFTAKDKDIPADGYMISRRAVFMGHWIRHGGLYPSYHLRLFRRSMGHCEEREYDQHFKVSGMVMKLEGDIVDYISTDLRSWTLSHERWAGMEVAEYFRQQQMTSSSVDQVQPRLFGTPIERRRWLRQKLYASTPLFVRPFVYFFIRYVFLLGFLDGTPGLIYHVLQGFWYRFYVDAKIWEATNTSTIKATNSLGKTT